MRLYTGLGDDGTTDLLGARVGKNDPRIEAIGALDEATSAIGFARSLATNDRLHEDLIEVQRDLYRIMAELAFIPELRPASYELAHDRVDWLGAETDRLTEDVDLPREFILPGESTPGAALDVARTVARRAERSAWLAVEAHGDTISVLPAKYLSRLSDLLFILSQVANPDGDVLWQPGTVASD